MSVVFENYADCFRLGTSYPWHALQCLPKGGFAKILNLVVSLFLNICGAAHKNLRKLHRNRVNGIIQDKKTHFELRYEEQQFKQNGFILHHTTVAL